MSHPSYPSNICLCHWAKKLTQSRHVAGLDAIELPAETCELPPRAARAAGGWPGGTPPASGRAARAGWGDARGGGAAAKAGEQGRDLRGGIV